MTRGRRSLIALLQVTTAREVAARCGVDPSCVSKWSSGIKAPGPTSRAKLEANYGIRAGSWVVSLPQQPGLHR